MTRAWICAVALTVPGALSAESILGTWASPPDPKGQTGHVVMQPCEAARGYCGTLVRAFSPDGARITTPNVGKTLLREMQPESARIYRGEAYVPSFSETFPATVTVEGDVLEVRGCALAGVVCEAQTWVRVQ